MRKNKNNLKNEICMIFLYFSLKAILDYVYVNTVNPSYSYMGLIVDTNPSKVIISYLVLVILVLARPRDYSKVSTTILQIHLGIMIVPFLSFYGLGNQSTLFMLMVASSFLIQIMLIRILPNIRVTKISNAKFIILFVLCGVTLVSYGYLFLSQGISFRALNIYDIYEMRGARNINNMMSRLITWQFRIINPFIAVIGYVKGNRKLLLSGLFLQFFMYLMYPNKEILLSILLIAFTIFMSKRRMQFDKIFIIILSISILVSNFIYKNFNNITPIFLGTVRFLNIPAVIKFWHYDFFSQNSKLYYAEGMIGKVLGLESPYKVASGYLMGTRGYANSGYIAYAYDNAGYIGMILMSILFVFVLVLINSLTKKMNPKIVLGLMIYPITLLNDTDLLTLLSTGGLWLLILILLLNINIGHAKDGEIT